MSMEGFGVPKFNKLETTANPEKGWETELDAAQNAEELASAIEGVPGGMLQSRRGGSYDAKGLVAEMRRSRVVDLGPAERSDVPAVESAAMRIRRQEGEEYMRKIREGK